MVSKIGWCSHTVNPFTGCDAGCAYCYARRMAHRLAHIDGPTGPTVYKRLSDAGVDPFSPAFHRDAYERIRDRLTRARKPQRVFVGSMGEICSKNFHRTNLMVEERALSPFDVWTLMLRLFRAAPQHTYLLLTKRPDRLPTAQEFSFPPNMQMGVSVTGNADAHRVGSLLARLHPTTHCWASVEPLRDADFDPAHLNDLDWVVVGAQTGTGARPSDAIVDAALRICAHGRDQGIPVYVKENMTRLRPAYPWPQQVLTGGNHA